MPFRLTDDQFADVVAEALADVPDPFKPYMADLAVDIEDHPDPRTLAELGLRGRGSLLGLYQGVPLDQRSVEHMYRIPERIVLYKRNLERFSRSRADLIDQIRKTTFHEVGHHFGMDEDQLRALGY